MGRGPGRPRAGKAPLSRERILAAALELVDEQGVEALSMRRLAGALGVDPMALYHHLPGKEAILDGLVALVFDELRVPPGASDCWQEHLRAFARAYRDLAHAHPGLVLHLATNPKAGAAAALRANERLYAALAAAGLAPREILRVSDLVVDFLNGFALAESSGRIGEADERDELLALLDRQPPDALPATRRLFAALAPDDLPADFEAELDIIVAGIEGISAERRVRSEER